MNDNTIALLILTIIQIPSFFCALQSIRFGEKNNPLKQLQNHVLACLLYASIWAIALDLPFTQAYLWSCLHLLVPHGLVPYSIFPSLPCPE
ncbi:unnamed protein product [Rotaria socialis]|uniref:Uncharacterized protein n=1 Tax=Rotaria socialis TaxID=392032 RepID=A0A817Z276_9BILA|nr:unnamed protein product [Rotaria socialis]CAF4629318.1 unnamed protein product [Rotaria socialis]